MPEMGAEYYDRIWAKGMKPGQKNMDRLRVMCLALDNPRRVLDVGCGPGWAITLLPGVEYVGVDISPVATTALGGIAYASLAEVPGTFDGCLLGEVLEHIEDDAGFLAEVRCLLDPGARVVVSVPKRGVLVNDPAHVHDYRPEQIEGLLGVLGEVVPLECAGIWALYKVVLHSVSTFLARG